MARRVRRQDVLETVADYFDVAAVDVVRASQHADVVRARRAAVWLLRYVCELSWSAIAETLERDSSSVRSMLSTVERKCDVDGAMYAELRELGAQLVMRTALVGERS